MSLNFEQQRKILLINLGSASEVLLTTPVLRILRQVAGDSHFVFVADSEAQEIIGTNSDLDEVLIKDQEEILEVHKQGKTTIVNSFKGLLKELKARKFDLVIDFTGSLATGLAAVVAGGKRVGLASGLTGLCYNKKLTVEPNLFLVEQYLQLLTKLGIEPAKYQTEFKVAITDKEEDYVKRLLERYRIGEEESLVAINLADQEGQLTTLQAVQLGDWLAERYDRVLLLGGKEERYQVTQIVNKMKGQALNLVGNLTRLELGALLKEIDLVITPNGILSHLAVVQESAVISLFGSGEPGRVGPYRGNNLVIKSSSDDLEEIEVETITEFVEMNLVEKH
ncbi:glycosyltransferase family 9 protein [Natroniella sp. ANB-PHB2]|uniref:glycosyltransferase family 9 protein n=1 Tax=Natroniella sp. ANB-PHB2 TaxID=3384444 RepID=UPI0038D4DD41